MSGKGSGWCCLAPQAPNSSKRYKMLSAQFYQHDCLIRFTATPVSVKGSGWGWLAYNKSTGGLDIVTTPNQDPCSVTVSTHRLITPACLPLVLSFLYLVCCAPLRHSASEASDRSTVSRKIDIVVRVWLFDKPQRTWLAALIRLESWSRIMFWQASKPGLLH